jgi:exodeoxyribonuclease VII small subunit
MKRKPGKTEIQNFEVSLEKLKSIVSQLENGKLTLSESLQRYEEGIQFLTECHAALNSAQMKIEQLVKLDEQGRLLTKPFDDTASFDNSSGRKSARTSGASDSAPNSAPNSAPDSAPNSARYSPSTDSVLSNKQALAPKPSAGGSETVEFDWEEEK